MKKVIALMSLWTFILSPLGALDGATGVFSKWEDTTYGIRDTSLYVVACDPINPETIYLGSSRSIYKTIDGGRRWKEILAIRGNFTAVNSIWIGPKDPSLIYAATQDGLYRSADAGDHWQRLFGKMNQLERDVLCIAIDHTNQDRIYLGTRAGLYLTNDRGKNWQKVSSISFNLRVSSMAIHPRKPNILYIAAPKGVFKTQNTTKTWEKIFITSEKSLDLTEEEALELSSENLETFNELRKGFEDVNKIEIDPSNPERVFLATQDGAFMSEDGGLSWKKLTQRGLLSTEIRWISISPQNPNYLWAATKKGVYEFSKDLNTWQELYSGITARDIRALSFNRNSKRLWAATDRGVFKIVLLPNPARGRTRADTAQEEILAHFADEPTIREIQDAAIRYAEVVDPKKIEKLRKGAKYKALLPDFDLDYDKTITYDSGIDKYITGPRDWGVGLSWDLGDLIWNEQQRLIDSQVRLMVRLREDILDEVTRLYFERRRLQVELLLEPPRDLKEKLEKELRLQELTADIDAITGGYLSRRLRKRQQAKIISVGENN